MDIKEKLAKAASFATLAEQAAPGGMVAVARGFNSSIVWSFGLGLLIAAGLGLFSDLQNLLITAAVTSLIGAMQFLLARRWLQTSSVVILLLLFVGVSFSMYRFGSISIAQASLSTIPIIYCVVILGERAGAALLALSIAGTAWITWRDVSGQFINASPTIPEAQWVVLTVGFFVAYRLAILFKRHLVDANIRINESQRLLLEEREQQNADLEKARREAAAASNAKSDFLANMSHEIRTPMNGVIGMVEVLQTTPMRPDQRAMVETIHRSSLTLLQILNDVLDLSKIEAGQMEMERIAFDLPDLVNSVAQLMQPVARKRSIELTAKFEPGVPRYLLGDPARLNQVLLNLLGNALKFTPIRPDQSGRVRIELRCVELSGASPALEIKVSDNGIGISANDLGRLFEPFAQADASTSRRFGGTGLGLSISRQLLEKMKGRLLVQSRLGEGSDFVIQIPIEQPGETALQADYRGSSRYVLPDPVLFQAPVTRHEGVEARSNRLILLAEDNETNLAVMQEQLRILGYRSETATNGLDALEMWRTGRFSLILADCQMPEMDGFELTARIRSLESNQQHTPIVAVTANALKGQAQRCLDVGMDDYLSKPLRLVELAALLSKWLPSPQKPATEFVRPVWDEAVLSVMVGEDRTMQRRLLERFLSDSKKQVANLVQACNDGDFETVANLAHKLKSACLTVGAMRLGEVCDQSEEAALEKDAKALIKVASNAQQALIAAEEKIVRQFSASSTSA